MIGWMIKTQTGTFQPTTECEDDFQEIRVGEIIKVKVSMQRNLGFHRKFFAMLKVGFWNQDRYDNFEIFRAVVISEAGFCKFVQVDNKIMFIPDSISFSNCDEIKFRSIYDKVLDVILAKYCHGLIQEEMDKKVLEILNFS